MHEAGASIPVRGPWRGSGNSSAWHVWATISTWANMVRDEALEGPQLEVQERDTVEAARRDRSAFTPLYRKYATPIYRYFYQQVASMEDAEDLTAATFSKALAGLDSYQMRGSFAAWLFGIARHTLMDHRRARQATGCDPVDIDSVMPLLADPQPGPEAQALGAEQVAYLRRLVALLPDEQREALVLRVFGELSTRDVAAILGKSDAAVKMLMHRAVETIRARYNSDTGEAGDKADTDGQGV